MEYPLTLLLLLLLLSLSLSLLSLLLLLLFPLSRQTSAQLGHHLPHPAHVPAGRGPQAVQALHRRQQREHQELQTGPQSDGGAGGKEQHL